MFSHMRRWFILPAILVLIVSVLVLTDVLEVYSDLPIELIAYATAGVAALILLTVLGLEGRAIVRSWELPEPEEPPRSKKVIEPKPLDDAEDAVEQAETFSRRATERVQIDIDIEDARDDE
jgi:hypothetical protein